MGINPSSLMMQLSPMAPLQPLQFGADGGGQKSMERERLRLMREEFEARKAQNARELELREMEENGRTTRERLQLDRQRQQQEAAAAAERRKLAQSAYGAAYKAVDSNDQAGVAMAANQLREFGGLAEQLGVDDQGRPSWRLGTDAAGYGERRQQADAVTKDIATNAPEGAVWLPPQVTQQATLDRLGALGLSGLDSEGVVSMGQNADTRAAQAQPSLDAYRDAFPEGPRRDSQASVNRAAVLRGLNPTETLSGANTLGAQPGAATQAAIDAEAKLAEEQVKADKPRPKEEQELIDYGYDRSTNAFKTQKTGDRIVSLEMADELTRLITSPNASDHGKAVNLMMVLGKQSGPQSDADAQRIAGNEDLSTIDQAKAWITKLVKGGKWESVQKSMVDFAARARERERAVVFSWMDSQNAAIANAKNELTAEGYKQFMRELPAFVLDEYKKQREAEDAEEGEAPMQGTPTATDIDLEPEEEMGPTGALTPAAKPGEKRALVPLEQDGEFMEALEAHASEAGLNVEDILPHLSFESGGDPAAANKSKTKAGRGSSAKGLIQMIDEVARGYGFKNSAEFAALSRAEQAPYVIRYLTDRGITAESDPGDIYVAITAPGTLEKSDDYVAYDRDAETQEERDGYELNAKHWDLNKDGKIRRGELHQLGTSNARRGKSKKKAEGSASSAEQQALDLLRGD